MPPTRPSLADLERREIALGLRRAWRVLRNRGRDQVLFWLLALLIGIAAGFAALAFRNAIALIQTLLYGGHDVTLASVAQDLPWWWILILPIAGGLLVGIVLDRFTPDGRVRSVADVIEGAAMHNGRVEIREGLVSAFASLVTLSSGGSSGREGPVVHLAGVISTWVCERIHADGITARDLLGCAVAAAVSASFNAPIAGALFAMEVVLRHFAMHAFAPIVIASVAGTVITRLQFGNLTEFTLPEPGTLVFYVELPAFLILGVVCGLMAVLLMASIFWTEDLVTRVCRRTGLPRWARPALAGALLGLIAIWFPHIIGVGYETTERALTGELLLHEAVVFAAIKCVAVVITLGGRMGGGVFSPSLMVGALTGLAFGFIATAVFPEVSGSQTLYALAGTGAVAAAVLGAPISTTLIVFELTGDWQTAIAVMTAVSISTALASRLVSRSFFLTQLERRGIRLSAGPQVYLLKLYRVGAVMRPLGHPRSAPKDRLEALLAEGLSIQRTATLDRALPLFEQTDGDVLPVVAQPEPGAPPVIVGGLFHIDALKAYNRALIATAKEEHS